MIKKETDLRELLNDDFLFNVSIIDGELSIDFKVLKIKFESYLVLKVGYPNDEIYMFDEFYNENNLASLIIYQILDSKWIENMEIQNSVHPRHRPGLFASDKHYRIYFEDEIFECVAKSYHIIKK